MFVQNILTVIEVFNLTAIYIKSVAYGSTNYYIDLVAKTCCETKFAMGGVRPCAH